MEASSVPGREPPHYYKVLSRVQISLASGTWMGSGCRPGCSGAAARRFQLPLRVVGVPQTDEKAKHDELGLLEVNWDSGTSGEEEGIIKGRLLKHQRKHPNYTSCNNIKQLYEITGLMGLTEISQSSSLRSMQSSPCTRDKFFHLQSTLIEAVSFEPQAITRGV